MCHAGALRIGFASRLALRHRHANWAIGIVVVVVELTHAAVGAGVSSV